MKSYSILEITASRKAGRCGGSNSESSKLLTSEVFVALFPYNLCSWDHCRAYMSLLVTRGPVPGKSSRCEQKKALFKTDILQSCCGFTLALLWMIAASNLENLSSSTSNQPLYPTSSELRTQSGHVRPANMITQFN